MSIRSVHLIVLAAFVASTARGDHHDVLAVDAKNRAHTYSTWLGLDRARSESLDAILAPFERQSADLFDRECSVNRSFRVPMPEEVASEEIAREFVAEWLSIAAARATLQAQLVASLEKEFPQSIVGKVLVWENQNQKMRICPNYPKEEAEAIASDKVPGK